LKRDISDQISAIRRQERKEEVWESKVERNSKRKFTQRLAEKRDGNTPTGSGQAPFTEAGTQRSQR